MDKFEIEGGTPLKGTVKISGAKNSVLPLMAASLLFDRKLTLRNVPDVMDVYTMAQLLRELGVKVERMGNGVWSIDPSHISSTRAPYEIVKKMRASIYVFGPLLVREKKAEVSLPGGCAFGPRPVDLHLKGLKALGAKINICHGYLCGEMESPHGEEIYFDKKSVGATAHLMMTAALIPDTTRLINVALEPEVIQLGEFLQVAGAKITGLGTDIIEITGKEYLTPPNGFGVIPDRIEAGTYAVAAYLTKGDVRIERCIPEHLRNVIDKLKLAGAGIEEGESWIRVWAKSDVIRPVNIHTAPFPGFPTDMQAQFMALMTVAKGTSVFKEGIYPDRFKHAFELNRLGADIIVENGTAIVNGVEKLYGAPVMATDLRASAALVLAGLIAEGKTIIDRIYHLDRGYDSFEIKLQTLGAKIKRVKS